MSRSKRQKAASSTASAAEALTDASVVLWCSYQQPEAGRFMICCDVQGPGCKIWYHGDCVGISKYRGKRMERDDIDFVCPVCSVHDSTEKTVNSTTMLGADPTRVNTVGLACAASPSTASKLLKSCV